MDNQEGGLKELVITSRRHAANEIIISIHDSAEGIDANQLDRLFQPFFTTKPAGTGMGLAIFRSIVESWRQNLVQTQRESWRDPSYGCRS